MAATILLAALAGLASACADDGESPGAIDRDGARRGRLSVYTVNYPLAYMAERIGGDLVEVVFPAPAGIDPAHWSPSGDVIARFQRADVILLNGAGYAGWVAHASLPEAALVDTSATFADALIPLEDALAHVHGPGGEHAHAATASTTWLDPTLAIAQARAVAEALAGRSPASAAAFQTHLVALEDDLRSLDHRLAAVAKRLGARPVLFSHPVYQYFERRHAVTGRSVAWEPEAAPSAGDWRALERLLAEHPAGWMLWEAEPLEATAKRLEALSVQSVVFEPCGNRPRTGDLLEAMTANVLRLEEAWQ